MPLVKLVKGARYQFDDVLVQRNEVIDVDARTRNRLVRSGHFIDAASLDEPAFIAMDEEGGEETTGVRAGGTKLSELDNPAITGARSGGRGSDIVNTRARKSKASQDEETGEGAEVT
jgi:hypothetical protein